MDPFSQALVGATAAQSFAKAKAIRTAAICGALGGMAPDLDIFIRSNTDPLLAIEYHRHFTHSLAFIPVGGLLVALALWLAFFRGKHSFLMIALFTTLGFATHGLLDACTSYGTRLLWPFSDVRVAWNVISIIDPIFTFGLLGFVVVSLVRRSVRVMRYGACFALLYLALGAVQHMRVDGYIRDVAASRGHVAERVLLNPTIGNHVLWRTVYQSGDRYYIDAVHRWPFSAPLLYEGTSVPVMAMPELPEGSVQYHDFQRFAYFSQGYIYRLPSNTNIIGDLRYGHLPNDLRSLWGIELNPARPDEPTPFVRLRRFNDRHYDVFWSMLQGKEQSAE